MATSSAAFDTACSAGWSPPAAKSTSNRNFAGALMIVLRRPRTTQGGRVGHPIQCGASRSSIDELLVGAALGDQDLAAGGEILGQIDEQRLRLVDVAQADRPHRLHVLDQHLGGARRHVAQEELAYDV